MYVQKNEDINAFQKHYEALEKPLDIILTRSDFEMAKLIVDLTELFNDLGRLISENNFLSHSYASLLIFIKKQLLKINNKMIEFGETTIRLDDVITTVDDYLQNIKENNDILFTCLAFSHSPEEYHNFFNDHFGEEMDIPGRLTEVAFTIGRIEYSPDEKPTDKEIENSDYLREYNAIDHMYSTIDDFCDQAEFRKKIGTTLYQEYIGYIRFTFKLMEEEFKNILNETISKKKMVRKR